MSRQITWLWFPLSCTPDFGSPANNQLERPMQSLLSASENNALQSFLSVMDYPDDTLTASEWALLSSPTSSGPTSSDNTLFVDPATPHTENRDALAKATKDLISLEPERWRAQSTVQDQLRTLQHPQQQVIHQQHLIQFHHHHQQQQRRLQAGLNASFSFPQGKPPLHYPGQHLNLVMNGIHPSPSSESSSSSSDHLLTSSTAVGQHRTVPMQLSHQLTDSSSDGVLGLPMRKSQTAASRHTVHPPSSSSSTTSSSSQRVSRHTSNSTSSKRNRASSSSPSSATTSTTPTPKQVLLSPSQKKANHIQSEQKRRANIRRGYEALCETVPALRDAIRQEEEEAALMAERNGIGSSSTGRKRRKKGQGKDGEEKDKIDGRAGPRSENVVLSKTIEHIQNLLSDRSSLLARLQQAQSLLPPGHPALTPLEVDPPWEREWKGGAGRSIAGAGDEYGGDGASSDGDEGF